MLTAEKARRAILLRCPRCYGDMSMMMRLMRATDVFVAARASRRHPNTPPPRRRDDVDAAAVDVMFER